MALLFDIPLKTIYRSRTYKSKKHIVRSSIYYLEPPMVELCVKQFWLKKKNWIRKIVRAASFHSPLVFVCRLAADAGCCNKQYNRCLFFC